VTSGHDVRHLATGSRRPTICAMTTEILPAADQNSAARRRQQVGRAVAHYVEMVVAMFVGMFALGPLEHLMWPALTARPEVGALVMATNMAVGMGAWMTFRGRSWRGIAEMSAAMYLPFAVFILLFWAGAVGADALMTWGHILMFPAMAAVMLLRPADAH
jgi:hypothetical protein